MWYVNDDYGFGKYEAIEVLYKLCDMWITFDK